MKPNEAVENHPFNYASKLILMFTTLPQFAQIINFLDWVK